MFLFTCAAQGLAMTDEPRKPIPDEEQTLSISGGESGSESAAERPAGQPESIGGFRIIVTDEGGSSGAGPTRISRPSSVRPSRKTPIAATTVLPPCVGPARESSALSGGVSAREAY